MDERPRPGTVAAPAGPSTPLRLLRFDRVQRAAHWANAALFGVCMLTGLPLYFSSIERLVGRHVLLVQVHVAAGLALPFPIVVSLVGPWGARMRSDLRRINRWTEQEVRWILRWTRRSPPGDKFNPGQKLNAIFVGGSIVVMLGTGAILEWFGPFPVSWRTGATFVHEVLSCAIFVVVAGHLVMAVTHRDAMRSMLRGWVSVAWARRNAPRWAEQELGRDEPGVTGRVSVAGPAPALPPDPYSRA